MPTFFPITISKNIPNKNPKISPIFFVANNPINNIKITNKFGFIPAIVNQLKKLDCKKYSKKNTIIIPTIDINFFNNFTSIYLL